MVRTLDPLAGGHLKPGDLQMKNLVKDHLAMLHTKFQASEHGGSEDEDFFNIFLRFCGSNLGPLGQGPSWTLEPWF